MYSESSIVNTFLSAQINLKMLHWVTTIYSLHKATEFLYDSLVEKTDKFIEVLQGGRKHRIKFEGKSIQTGKFTYKSAKKDTHRLLLGLREFLLVNLSACIKPSETELLNIRDEMLADVDQTLYLLTLS